jgi:Flp pilus assembly protein CpaB
MKRLRIVNLVLATLVFGLAARFFVSLSSTPPPAARRPVTPLEMRNPEAPQSSR